MNSTKEPLLKRIVDFLGLNKTMITMLIMVIFLGLGEKMAERGFCRFTLLR